MDWSLGYARLGCNHVRGWHRDSIRLHHSKYSKGAAAAKRRLVDMVQVYKSSEYSTSSYKLDPLVDRAHEHGGLKQQRVRTTSP